MQRDVLERLMISALYGDISPEENRQLQLWFEEHPGDRQIYDDLKAAQQFLNRKSETSAPVERIHASQIMSERRGYPWYHYAKYAAFAAAACLLALLCMTQGVAVQVGDFRMAFGPAAGEDAVQRMIQQEIEGHYALAAQDLAEDLREAKQDWNLIAQWQLELEQSMQYLALLRSQDVEIQQRTLRQLVNRLDHSIDRRIGEFYLVAFADDYEQTNINSGVRVNNQNNLLEENENDER